MLPYATTTTTSKGFKTQAPAAATSSSWGAAVSCWGETDMRTLQPQPQPDTDTFTVSRGRFNVQKMAQILMIHSGIDAIHYLRLAGGL